MVSKTRKSKDKQDFQAICFADEASRNAAYQDIEERRLKEWENFQKSHRTPEDQKINRAFIDISIGDVLAGRLVIDLYDNLVPRTVERFRSMITGELGVDKATGTKIDYLHTKLQRIDKERNLLCFGSFSMNIVPRIEDENYSLRHTERGLLTMISHGPNTARSGFGITLGPVPSLDFRQVAFGKVVDGFSVLEKLEAVPVNAVGKPLTSPFITFCGVLTGRAPPGSWKVCERTPNNTPVWQSLVLDVEEEVTESSRSDDEVQPRNDECQPDEEGNADYPQDEAEVEASSEKKSSDVSGEKLDSSDVVEEGEEEEDNGNDSSRKLEEEYEAEEEQYGREEYYEQDDSDELAEDPEAEVDEL